MLIKSIILASFLLVHSWYPSECCSDNDCKPIPCKELQKILDSGAYPTKGIRPSPDNECHICIFHVNDLLLCAFIPQGA